MCLAVPVCITECLPDGMARAQVGESSTYLDLSTLLLPEPVAAGDYVIVHAGFALRKLDLAEAEESLKIFRQIAGLGQDSTTESA